jgi:hypothetical protein
MTVTTLDPNTALIVIDLQKGLVGLPTVHPFAGVLASATVLTSAFHGRRTGPDRTKPQPRRPAGGLG